MDKWIEMFNIPMHASEEWKIDWDLKHAVCVVENETMRTMVGVDEYSEIIELKNDSKDDSKNDSNETDKDKDTDEASNANKDESRKVECIFIKKLYVHTNKYVGIPQFVIDSLCKQYTSDSDHQMNVICQICESLQ